MSRRFAMTSLMTAMVLGLLFTAPLWAAKGGGGGGGGGKPGGGDPPPPEPPPFEYVLQILPMLDDGDPDTTSSGVVRAMNEFGEMVGQSYNGSKWRAVLWTDGGQTLTNLNDLLAEGSDWVLMDAQDINDVGQIVGRGYLLPDVQTQRVFRYTPGEPAVVEDLSEIGIVLSETVSINILGHVAGTVNDGEGLPQGAVYTGVPGTLDADDLILIGLPENGRLMRPYAINDLGQVTGRISVVIDGGNKEYAFRYTPPGDGTAAAFDLFALNEGRSVILRSEGYAINNSGQVVGQSQTKANSIFSNHAFRDGVDSAIEDLGVLSGGNRSWAYAINDSGDVTGLSHAETGFRGFIYLDGFGMVNLDDLVVGDDADLAIWNAGSIYPRAINNPLDEGASGQISGYIQASPHVPFLLTPQPLP